MSHLASKTERKAIKVLANTLRFFQDTNLLFISAEDAFAIRHAELMLRAVIESNGYTARYQKGKGTKILKEKNQNTMQTNFFEHISALEFQGALNLNLIKNAEGFLTVSVYLPNATSDTAGNLIPPMILKGNASELNEGFFNAIAAPVKQTASLFANLDAYQQSLKKAADNSKAEFDKKNKANKAKSTTASTADTDEDDEQDETENLFSIQENEQKALAEKKKRYASVLEQVAELSKVFKYDEAISLLQTCADYLEKAEEIKEKGAELLKHKAKYEAFINDLA